MSQSIGQTNLGSHLSISTDMHEDSDIEGVAKTFKGFSVASSPDEHKQLDGLAAKKQRPSLNAPDKVDPGSQRSPKIKFAEKVEPEANPKSPPPRPNTIKRKSSLKTSKTTVA
jgi:hypothetical protein